jgi:homoprotocatechuate degradation regulator HpaR
MMKRKRREQDAGAEAPAPAAGSRQQADKMARRELPMRAFSRSLPMDLLRAREAVMRRFRPALRDHGVTEQQWRILRALAHAGPLEVSELAEATCLLAPSLSRILPDMEARHLIARRQADTDLRRSVISLERDGLRLIATHAPQSEAIYEDITRRFGAERLAQLFALLHELEEALDASEKATMPAPPKAKVRAPSAGPTRSRSR